MISGIRKSEPRARTPTFAAQRVSERMRAYVLHVRRMVARHSWHLPRASARIFLTTLAISDGDLDGKIGQKNYHQICLQLSFSLFAFH